MSTDNQALTDELEAVNSIYGSETLKITKADGVDAATCAVLALPDLPFSFVLSFPTDYPDVAPAIVETQSTGPSTKKGEGQSVATLLRDILGRIFIPGQVCLFDLVEETQSLLNGEAERAVNPTEVQGPDKHGAIKDTPTPIPTHRSVSSSTAPMSTQLSAFSIQDLNSSLSTATVPSIPPSAWILSEILVVNKSTFVGRALAVTSLTEATDSISHLLATDKKVANATHNITAWRIKQKQSTYVESKASNTKDAAAPEIIVQDCDDDGETAAGGRLLHLMQLMDVWNVVVVVTRWYGGVKLGPDRFRCINLVGREALVNGGFVKEEAQRSKLGKGKKK